MPVKKIIVTLLVIAVAIGGFVSGLVLLRQRQELREQASVPGGQATVSITPSTGSFNVGDIINTSIYFNTANIAISGVAVRLTYPYSGNTPEVSVASIEVNPSFLSSIDWTCPTQNPSLEGGNVIIDIACANTSAQGFATNQDTLLANVGLRVERIPSVRPLVVRFDPAASIITRKSDNQDILLIPSSTGSYSFGGEPQPTQEPTGGVSATPTVRITATPTPTKKLTATPTSTASATPSGMTGKGGLPNAGVSYPTYFGLGLGVIVIIGALLLSL